MATVGGLELGHIQSAVVERPKDLPRYLVVALMAAPAEVIEEQYLGVREEDLQVKLLVVSVVGSRDGQSVLKEGKKEL